MEGRVLVTGASGMVGSHLIDHLFSKTSVDIFGMVRWRSPLENISHHISQINSQKRIFLEYGDLLDEESLRRVVKRVRPDYVFHLAAQSFPQTSFDAPINTLDTNILGTYRLLSAIQEFSPLARVHVCSSSEVFGRVPREKIPITEENSFHPASPYAISKVGTDVVGQHFADAYGLHVIITRMFTHTGPRRGDVFAESSFAKQIAMIELGQIRPVIQVGNLDSIRTYADVRDAVSAYIVALTKDLPKGERYNIGGNFTCSVREMLDKLISKSRLEGIEVEIDKGRIRPLDADLQVPNIDKFTKATGWAPSISFDETMSDLLEYWRDKVKSGHQLQR